MLNSVMTALTRNQWTATFKQVTADLPLTADH